MSAESSIPSEAAGGSNIAGSGGKRTLATIVFTDVVGFSERVGRDEAGTLALLERDCETMRALCAKHDGQVIKSVGDGLLLFFGSAVEAVACAVEIQNTFARRGDTPGGAAGLQHRIGVHLGDVFVREDDVMGDGVNIASRLQAEAGPGGICVSQTVYDVVKNALDLRAVALGPRALKNIRGELPIYRILADGQGLEAPPSTSGATTIVAAPDDGFRTSKIEAGRGTDDEDEDEDDADERTTLGAMLGLPTPRRKRRARRLTALGIAAAIALAGATGGYFLWRNSGALWPKDGPTAASASSPSPATVAPRDEKSIAVLPFVNMSEDPQNEFFARGVHEDVLTQLAHVSDLKVISRTSVQAYQGPNLRKTSLREIGEALGAAAIVEGSVRREGNRVRVTAQLIDARTDRHLWADAYDRDLTDVFAIQSAIARDIVNALRVTLSPKERERLEARPTSDAEAYDLYLRARDIALRPGNLRENLENALRLSDQALARDPSFALANVMQANLHNTMYWYAYDRTPERRAQVKASVDRALQLQPELPEAHQALGQYYYWGFRDYERALAELAIARRDLPNSATLFGAMGFIQRRQGKWDEALANLQKNAELDPRNADHRYEVALTLHYMRRYPEAEAAVNLALSLAPDYRAAGYHRGILAMKLRGETRTLRAALEGIHPGFDINFWDVRRYQLEMLDRRFDAALALLAASPLQKFEWQDFLYPKTLLIAQAEQVRGNATAARTNFESARATLEELLKTRPDDPRLHAALGYACAGLGRKDDAIRSGREAVRLLPESKDAVDGPVFRTDLAAIYAQTGEPGLAMDEIARLLAEPAVLSEAELRLDPIWDPLRKDPRFRQRFPRAAP